jgi:hypothetical protein
MVPHAEPLTAHEILDPVDPRTLDRFTRLAAHVLDVPAVRVSLVDGHRRRVVGSYGLHPPAGLGRATSHIEVPLSASDGRRVGTLTVMGRSRRPWSTPHLAFLRELSVRLVREVDIGPADRMM